MLEQLLLVLAAGEDSEAYRAGYRTGLIIGQCVPVVLFSAAALKCYSISRRPTTNAKCCLALMFFFIGWILAMLPQIAVTADLDHSIVFGIAMLAFSACILLSLIFGVIGLTELRAHPGRWVQGRRQAIWSLALVALAFSLAAFGAYREYRDSTRVPDSLRVAGSEVPRMIRNHDLNFTFELPGMPWVQVDAKKFNSEASLAVARARPTVFFMIIAEETGSKGLVLDNDTLVEIVRVNMGAAATSFEIVDQRPRTVNDMEGVHIHARATIDGMRLSYGYWVCARNGYAYQCIATGDTALEDQVLRDAEELSGRFRMSDPDRSTLPAPQYPLFAPRPRL